MVELKANADLREELSQLMPRVDAEEELMVSRQTLRNALRRFLANEVVASDLMVWANLIEANDKVRYEPGFEKVVADIVFYIASPEINEPLSAEFCQRLLVQLGY